MMWNYPLYVEIDGEKYAIEKQCDYRVVLDCLCVYEDEELDLDMKHRLALTIFYENPKSIKNIEEAVKKMLQIIDYNATDENNTSTTNKMPSQRLMSWEKDFPLIAPPVSRILGYDIRDPNKYTHWYSFMGAYLEIGDCLWSTVISIRYKRLKGKKLESWEKEFCREHKELVYMPVQLTDDEKEFLYSA